MPIGSEVTDYFCIAVGFCKVFLTQRGKSLSAGEDNGGRVISVHFIHFCFFAVSHSSNCDLPHFWRMGFFSWLRKCVTLSHPIGLHNSLIFNIRNLMGQKVMKSENISNVTHTRPSTPHSLFVRICQRTWNEPKTHTGADTNAPGSRHSRIWEQRRTPLGADTVEPGTMFADRLRGRIDETFLQYNNA